MNVSRKCMPDVIRHLAGIFNQPVEAFQSPTVHQDKLEATDLLLGKLTIAVRVRDAFKTNGKGEPYFKAYKNEMTLRGRIPGHLGTELDKIIDGYGDYMFYGWADTDSGSIMAWTIIDLAAFRAHVASVGKENLKATHNQNIKADSTYYAIDINMLSLNCIFARWSVTNGLTCSPGSPTMSEGRILGA